MNEPIKLLIEKLDELEASKKKARELEPDQQRLAEVEKNLNSQIEIFEAAIEKLMGHNGFLLLREAISNTKANHKLFGEVDILGVRTECSENNNLMLMIKNNDKYYWIYDYETRIINNICYKTGKECKYNCSGLCKDSC